MAVGHGEGRCTDVPSVTEQGKAPASELDVGRLLIGQGSTPTVLFLVTDLGGVLTILSPCILPVLPFVFARSNQPFVKSGLPLLVGMALTFAGVERGVEPEPVVFLGR